VSSLPESLRQVGKAVSAFFASPNPAETPPYLVYVYPPKEEYQVRRELADLRLQLGAEGVNCVALSLADLFWEAIGQAGWLERVFEEEEGRRGDEEALREVADSVNQILTGPPSLADRVRDALKGQAGNCAAFLYRAGALYPSYRTSTLLDDLKERLPIPVVLLYPGRMAGSFGLSFMGRCQPTHGYRATKIIPREGP
jgi:hypothetical protein